MRLPAVLHHPGFRRVWTASLASNCGSWLQAVAAGWLVNDLTGSPTLVGALALAVRGPAFALSMAGGQLADRFDRRHVGMATFLLQAIAGAGMAALAATDNLTVPLIFALSLALGIGFALGLPAMLALIPALVPPTQLSQAVSLNAAGINVARLAGPAIGGVVLAAWGPTWCFGLNALSFLVLIAALATVRPHQGRRGVSGVGMRAALAVARRDPAIRRLLMGMTVFAALASPIQELAPVVASALGAGPRGLGLLLGAMGGGALLGAWLLERLQGRGMPRGTALPLATAVFGAGMAALAAAPAFIPALAAMGACGAFWIWMFIATNTSVQLRAPMSMVGRLLGLYQLSVVGPIALGSLGAGALADLIGIRASLAVCAGALVAFGLWGLRNRVPEIDAGRAEEPASIPGTA